MSFPGIQFTRHFCWRSRVQFQRGELVDQARSKLPSRRSMPLSSQSSATTSGAGVRSLSAAKRAAAWISHWMANRAARSRPGARLDKGGALHKAVERIDVIQPRRILIGTEPRPRPAFPTGSYAPSGCPSGMTEMRLVQAGRSPASKPGFGWRDQAIASQTRSDQKLPGAFAYSLFGPSRGMRRIVHARTIRHGVQATIIPSKNACAALISGEFRAKTKSGSRQTTQQGTNQPEGYWIKKRTKKTVLLTVPKKRPRNARIPCPASARSDDPADPLFGHDSQTTPIR